MTLTSPINVLFLCTGNSARSILSECLCNDLGGAQWNGFSAGSKPSGIPHPEGLAHLMSKGHAVGGYSSKSWDVFARPDAPVMDIIITVCDNAAGEVCPVWPHRGATPPIVAHWPADDPAHVEPLSARQAAFSDVYDLCKTRIEMLLALDTDMPRDALTAAIRAIGKS